jgi:GNAT superfamily N-acetyltransferase
MDLSIEIRALTSKEKPDAVRILARGMRDNPLHVRAFDAAAEHRVHLLESMFGAVVGQQLSRGSLLGAFRDGELVGVGGMMPPGQCPAGLSGKFATLSALVLGSGLGNSHRVLQWLSDWAATDASVEHWHLGPMVVEPRLRGQGIGTALLRECCRRIDADGSAAYLENDKAENLPLFERFGFQVAEEHEVLGVRNWFMLRAPAK